MELDVLLEALHDHTQKAGPRKSDEALLVEGDMPNEHAIKPLETRWVNREDLSRLYAGSKINMLAHFDEAMESFKEAESEAHPSWNVAPVVYFIGDIEREEAGLWKAVLYHGQSVVAVTHAPAE